MPRRSLIVRLDCRSALALLCLVAPAFPPLLRAAPQATASAKFNEEFTAKFLFNFLSYIEWPATAKPPTETAPFVIGVSRDRPLLDALISYTAGKKVENHPVHVKRLKDVDDLASCHLAFLNSKPDSDGMGVPIPDALKALKGKPVLTVSTARDFLADGGLVQLYLGDSGQGFDIAREIARATGLKLDSRMVGLAKPVPVQP